jgi:hypothetical protein
MNMDYTISPVYFIVLYYALFFYFMLFYSRPSPIILLYLRYKNIKNEEIKTMKKSLKTKTNKVRKAFKSQTMKNVVMVGIIVIPAVIIGFGVIIVL